MLLRHASSARKLPLALSCPCALACKLPLYFVCLHSRLRLRLCRFLVSAPTHLPSPFTSLFILFSVFCLRSYSVCSLAFFILSCCSSPLSIYFLFCMYTISVEGTNGSHVVLSAPPTCLASSAVPANPPSDRLDTYFM